MITFRDKTFCASPRCTNACGRKLTDAELKEYERLNTPEEWGGMLAISYAYFCGEPKDAPRT